jgi:hypothetical protein
MKESGDTDPGELEAVQRLLSRRDKHEDFVPAIGGSSLDSLTSSSF